MMRWILNTLEYLEFPNRPLVLRSYIEAEVYLVVTR